MSVILSMVGQDDIEIAELAKDVAADFDLLASIESAPPVVTVTFVRAAPSGDE